MGVNFSLVHLNAGLTQMLGTWSGGLAPRGLEALEGGPCVVFLLIQFP